jgi:hypothetical protein
MMMMMMMMMKQQHNKSANCIRSPTQQAPLRERAVHAMHKALPKSAGAQANY